MDNTQKHLENMLVALSASYLDLFGGSKEDAKKAVLDALDNGANSPHHDKILQATGACKGVLADHLAQISVNVEGFDAQERNPRLVADAGEEPTPDTKCECFCRATHDPSHSGVCSGKFATHTLSYEGRLGVTEVLVCADCRTQVLARAASREASPGTGQEES